MGQSCGVASVTTHGLWVAFQVQTVVHSSHCGILTFAVLGSVHGHLVQVLRVSVCDWQVCDNKKMPQRG